MAAATSTYDLLATLFSYPASDYMHVTSRACTRVAHECPEAGTLLAEFAEQLRSFDTTGLEELFTQTFDLNPVCCPEVGWHLFGERYDRGSFLVWMRAQLREFGMPETGELPDHLMYVLPVLGRMNGEDAKGFATQAVAPALAKMRESLEKKENPYGQLLASVQTLLLTEFGEAAPAKTPWGGAAAMAPTNGSEE